MRSGEIVGRFDPATGIIHSGAFNKGATLAQIKSLILDVIIESRIAQPCPGPPDASQWVPIDVRPVEHRYPGDEAVSVKQEDLAASTWPGKTLVENAEKVVSVKQDDPKQPMEPSPPPHLEVPRAPELHPKLGDKTPAYMEWLATYRPEEFDKKYRGRKTHLTTGMNPHLEMDGDIPPGHMQQEKKEEWK